MYEVLRAYNNIRYWKLYILIVSRKKNLHENCVTILRTTNLILCYHRCRWKCRFKTHNLAILPTIQFKISYFIRRTKLFKYRVSNILRCTDTWTLEQTEIQSRNLSMAALKDIKTNTFVYRIPCRVSFPYVICYRFAHTRKYLKYECIIPCLALLEISNVSYLQTSNAPTRSHIYIPYPNTAVV